MLFKKLSELATIDISNVDKKNKTGEQKVKLCNFVDVYHKWALKDSMVGELMSATANENQISRFKLHSGQVAITKDSETKDDIGMAMLVDINMPDIVLGYHCALITPDGNELSASYLNVVLHSSYASKYFEMNASGSGQRYTLTNDIIGNFPVPMISLKEQESISDVFDQINNKILTNNAIISELESMAKDIYDYWFVQFDFPDENGKPYKSSGGKMVWNEELKREIPEGWKVKTINDILGNYPQTQRIPSEEYQLRGDYPIIDQSRKYIAGFTSDSTKILNIKDVLVFGDHTNVCKYVNFPFARGADGTQIITSKEIELSNLLLFQQVVSMPQIEQGYSRHFKFLKQQSIVIPNNKKSVLFDTFVSPLMEMRKNALKENYELSSLQDFLLPLLMNGQVKIGDVEP
ncbi:MAG: restriction endonuclease subunit S [Spirochaetales bacterium]|nr:restriction endonuclease subunit S [Spirochaetales bacterium]